MAEVGRSDRPRSLKLLKVMDQSMAFGWEIYFPEFLSQHLPLGYLNGKSMNRIPFDGAISVCRGCN